MSFYLRINSVKMIHMSTCATYTVLIDTRTTERERGSEREWLLKEFHNGELKIFIFISRDLHDKVQLIFY